MDDIKDQFVDDYLNGRRPTLQHYFELYPDCDRMELIEFVFELVALHDTPLEIIPPSPEAIEAMEKGLEKAKNERLAVIGMQPTSITIPDLE